MATYLVFEALIRQSMGDLDGARRAARQAELLSAAQVDARVIRITSYLAEGNRERAEELVRELKGESPRYDPSGSWPEPFPQAVIDELDEPLRSSLEGSSYAEGVAMVLRDLGWQAPNRAVF